MDTVEPGEWLYELATGGSGWDSGFCGSSGWWTSDQPAVSAEKW